MFVCVKDGKPLGSIHIPAWAQPHEEFAAEELSKYIKKSTGAEPPVVRSLKRVRRGSFVLADLCHPASPRLLPKGVGDGLRYDGFRMRAVKGALYIVSGEPGGLVFGVYEYLRRYVGCCFLDRGEAGENIPRRRDISHANLDELDNPRIWYRGLQTWPEPKHILGDRVDWMAKNGFSHLLVDTHRPPTVSIPFTWEKHCRDWIMPELRKRGLKLALEHHNFQLLLPKEQYLSERRDFYAKVNGKRDAVGQLHWCVSNEELVETVARSVIQIARENPEADTVQFWPEDGMAPVCECADCAALDDPRDNEATDWSNLCGKGYGRRGDRAKMRRYLHLANAVAERLAAVYPRVRLNVLSYMDLTDPPVDAYVHPNIIICLAIYWRCSHHNLFDAKCPVNRNYQKCIEEWLKVIPGESLIFYDYYMGMFCWSCLPWPILTNLFPEWDVQAGLGMGGAHIQSHTNHLGVYGINYVAFARLGRANPPTFDEFMGSYCRDFFGPAAKPMEAVYRVWEACMQTGGHHEPSPTTGAGKLFTEASVKSCRRHIAKALTATDNPIYRRRIERVLALADYVHLWREVPVALAKMRAGVRISARAKADCLAWLRRLDDFAEQHRALNDGLFPHNPADFLRRGWVEKM